IYFYPEAKAYHFLGASTRKAKSKMIYLSHRGYYKFLKKHRTKTMDKILLIPSYALLYIGAVIRIILQRIRSLFKS
ncbi:MAG: hypothetical protein WBD28_07805, partial [Candidatus Zixiibacteriota bacterium]